MSNTNNTYSDIYNTKMISLGGNSVNVLQQSNTELLDKVEYIVCESNGIITFMSDNSYNINNNNNNCNTNNDNEIKCDLINSDKKSIPLSQYYTNINHNVKPSLNNNTNKHNISIPLEYSNKISNNNIITISNNIKQNNGNISMSESYKPNDRRLTITLTKKHLNKNNNNNNNSNNNINKIYKGYDFTKDETIVLDNEIIQYNDDNIFNEYSDLDSNDETQSLLKETILTETPCDGDDINLLNHSYIICNSSNDDVIELSYKYHNK